jgi:hypothetical protein
MITVPAPSTPSQPVMAARSRPEWATLGTGPYVAVKNFTGIGAKRLGGTVLINYTRDTSSHHTCNKAQEELRVRHCHLLSGCAPRRCSV